MKLVLLLASRYLFSKKSNNIITLISWISLLAIAFTTAAFIIIISVMNGFSSVVGNLYNSIEPDIKITPAAGKYFIADTLIPKINHHPNIQYIAKCISNQSLLKHNSKQLLVTVKGVDSVFQKATRINTVIQKGTFLLKNKNINYCVVGQGILNELNVSLNNPFVPLIFYSPKRIKNTGLPVDIINEKPAYISGAFTINDDFDYKYVFCDLQFAQDLFDAENLISSLEIYIQDKNNLSVTQNELKALLGPGFIVKNRNELNEVLFKTLQTEKLWTFLILGFIILIATFSIISALTMLVIEKQQDIQTLYALGANKKTIENIFMAEGFLITFGGAFIGLIIGIIVCQIQINFHIISFNENSILPYYPVELQYQDIAIVLIILLLIGFFAAIYPVRMFTKNIRWNK